MKTIQKDAVYSLFLLLLSIYVLSALGVEVLFNLEADTLEILRTIDFVACLIFLADFFVRLLMAKSKLGYLKWGWIDFISSIPSLDVLRWGRISRLVRIFRFLRGLRSIRILLVEFRRRKSESVVLLTIFLTLMVFLYGSIGVMTFERTPNSPGISPQEAMWWTLMNLLNAKVSLNQMLSSETQILTVLLNRFGLLVFAALNGVFIAWLVQSKRPPLSNQDQEA